MHSATHHALLVLCCLVLLTPSAGFSADPAPQQSDQRLIEQGSELTSAEFADDVKERDIADIAIFGKAAMWIVKHDEFYKPEFRAHAQQAIDIGQARREAVKQGKRPWMEGTGSRILGYRSKIDGSFQPYAISLPEGVNPRQGKRWPLHIVLHGRGGTLNEVSFIKQHEGKPLAEGQDWIELHVFGRTNNGYRWAGETDLFEALADVERRFRLDDQRITLWGFSMGGAGAWHLGLHHPSMWSSVGAGAGFVDLYNYQNRKDPLPSYQHRTLRIYDSLDYALNLADVPFVTYGGELDKQLAASKLMIAAANEKDVPLEFILGKQAGHKFTPEGKEAFMAFHTRHSQRGRPSYSGQQKIRFVTYTPKYNECEWATIEEMVDMYEPAIVESSEGENDELLVTTQNVAALRIDRNIAPTVVLDDHDPIRLANAADGLLPDVYFVNDGLSWLMLNYDQSREFMDNPNVRKRKDLQGPIDDAFMQPFLCVKGTSSDSSAWSTPLDQYVQWSLDRFGKEFDKWMRGRVPVTDDKELTEEQIENHSLILFGDPGSNSVIRRVVGDLPIEWTEQQVTINGESYDTQHHAVVLIYPNPLNSRRYVVINSGHTIHERDFRASNSTLYPRLGDIAVLKFKKNDAGGYDEETVWAGLFNTDWELPTAEDE